MRTDSAVPSAEAHRAAHVAEDRLRQLRPKAMSHYNDAIATGFDPAEAMRQTAWAFDRPASRADDAAPDRALPDGLRSAARTEQAAVDDLRTSSVDEHTDGVTAGGPHSRPRRRQRRRGPRLALSARARRAGLPRPARS